MSKSIRVTKKSRGRPKTTGIGTQIGMRWQEPTLLQIDAWIAKRPGEMSRPEAIRRLVEQALCGSKPPKHVAHMAPLKSEPPGMERDSKGHAIPMKERVPEDRAKAKRAKNAKGKPRK